MNPIQQCEQYRLDHQERLQAAHDKRYAQQLPRRPALSSWLSRSLRQRLGNLLHGQRQLELAQPR